MIDTYRKWKNTNEVVFISQFMDWDYYCEAEWYEDSFRFDKEYIEEESIEATENEINEYKINKKKYNT